MADLWFEFEQTSKYVAHSTKSKTAESKPVKIGGQLNSDNVILMIY